MQTPSKTVPLGKHSRWGPALREARKREQGFLGTYEAFSVQRGKTVVKVKDQDCHRIGTNVQPSGEVCHLRQEIKSRKALQVQVTTILQDDSQPDWTALAAALTL